MPDGLTTEEREAELVFICHPLKGTGRPAELEENIEILRKLCRYYIEEFGAGRSNKIPICTALYFAGFLDDTVLRERELGILGGHYVMGECNSMDVYDIDERGGISAGMVRDIEEVRRLGKMVNYYDKYPWEE